MLLIAVPLSPSGAAFLFQLHLDFRAIGTEIGVMKKATKKKAVPRCRRIHVTKEQLLAIEDAESIVRRMAASFDIYGGVDTKACLEKLEPLMGLTS